MEPLVEATAEEEVETTMGATMGAITEEEEEVVVAEVDVEAAAEEGMKSPPGISSGTISKPTAR